jgi:hypothetical protein
MLFWFSAVAATVPKTAWGATVAGGVDAQLTPISATNSAVAQSIIVFLFISEPPKNFLIATIGN